MFKILHSTGWEWAANILLAWLNLYLELRQFMIPIHKMTLFQDTNNKSSVVYPERWVFYYTLWCSIIIYGIKIKRRIFGGGKDLIL